MFVFIFFLFSKQLPSYSGFFFQAEDGIRDADVTRVQTCALPIFVGGTINGVMYGIVGTGLAQGLAAVVGLLIAGVPGALMLGFITAILSIVPAGPPLIWISATIWLLFQDMPGWAVFMALWGFFIVSGIDNIVKPLLISRGSSLPFVLVLLGVLGGIL